MQVTGILGAVLATFGFLLPQMAVVLLLSLLYRRYRSILIVGTVFSY